VALERAKARSAQQAARDERAGRRQQARLEDRAERRRRNGSNGDSGGSSRRRRNGTDSGSGDSDAAATDGRTTLGQALADETVRRAARRLENRRTNPDPDSPGPPFLSKKEKEQQADGQDDDAEGAEKKPGDGPKVDLSKKPAAEELERPKVDLSKKPKKPAEDSAGKPSDEGPAPGATQAGPKPDAAAAAGPDDGGPGTGWEFWAPPPRGERRSAAESAERATEEPTVITLERLDNVGDQEPPPWTDGQERPVQAAAAITTGVREEPAASGSTITKGAPVSAIIPTQTSVDPEHMTEVTLDDVLDQLSESKDECFTTYDECAVLADKAIKLRDSLADLAVELRQRHNVIGRLTSWAMARLAESMDLLARKAIEMRAKSLEAAEKVELAHDAMHDAYRPVQVAAAAAGLEMPSARIHNEE
jgi:hypothetical protein